MRTTIEMPDPLLREVKAIAAKRGTSVRAIVIESLETCLNRRPSAFKLRDASFGKGPAISNDAINDAIDASRETIFPGWLIACCEPE